MATAPTRAPAPDKPTPETAKSRQPTDQALLEAYVARGDQGAFAALVERHGKTVWNVCRRVLHQEQDTEDAFQAVFVILARKAASIRRREAVGSWLYGVAHRTAMKARRSVARRQKHERHANEPPRHAEPVSQPEPWSEAACRELQRVLDEEVQSLGGKYRTPFVLCCLQGMSKGEAASELGWKEGTVSARVSRARKLLQARLARRGITLSAVLTALALPTTTTSAAFDSLLHATAVAAPAAGNSAASSISPAALTLAKAVLRAMRVARGKTALLLFVGLLVLLGGVAVQLRRDVLDPDVFVGPPTPLGTPIDEQVLSVAFAPGGQRLVTAGGGSRQPGQIQIWEVATRKNLSTLRPLAGVRSVAFAPDGRTFATADFSGAIKVRDAAGGGEQHAVHAHEAGVSSVAFAPDGNSLLSAGRDRTVKLWQADGLAELKTFQGHTAAVLTAAFFHKTAAIVSGSEDNTAIIWDMNIGKARLTLRGHRLAVEAVAVSADDKLVASASRDGTVKLWNAETGEGKAVLHHGLAVYAVAFSGDGKLLATARADGHVRVWDVNTQKLIGVLGKHEGAVRALAFSPDGTLLASGSSDKTARLWHVASGKSAARLATLSPLIQPILALAYSPNGKVVAMATSEPEVQIRDALSGDVLRLLKGHAGKVNCLAFSPNGQALASGSSDQTVRLWDWDTGREVGKLKQEGEVHALGFTRDGKSLAAAGSDGRLKLWDLSSKKEIATFSAHAGAVYAIGLAPDGHTIATGGADRTVKIWDVTGTKPPVAVKGHSIVRALAFSAEGVLASAGDDGVVELWKADQGRLALVGHTGAVTALAFTPSGRTLVSASRDKTVRIWDSATSELRAVLHGHKEPVTTLAIHPRGKDLLSGSLDTMALRWRGAKSMLPLSKAPESSPENEPKLKAALRHSKPVVPASLAPLSKAQAVAGDWPMWRGPRNNGSRAEASPVLNWSDADGVRWKVAVPGQGHASPVVLGDHVLVSTADEQTETRSVLCFHRHTGALLWNTVVDRGGFMAKHDKNSHASPTPACDGRRLYVPFVARDALWLHAIDVNGQPAWKRRIGPFAQREGEAWGYASSPALYKDLVIVAGDNQGSDNSPEPPSYLAAVRCDTGEIAWRVPRPRAPSYGTPIVARVAGREQLVLAGAGRITAYDPASGKELWFCRWSGHRSASSVAFGPDCIYSSTDWPERHILCVRADGNGDVTDSHIVWRQARGACDVPSTLYHQGRLYVVNNNGMMTCLDSTNGKVAWQKRLGMPFSASPVAAADHIFATDEEGTTHVIELGDPVRVLAHNSLRDRVLASLALSGNDIFVRSHDFLWCLDGKSHGESPKIKPAGALARAPGKEIHQDFRNGSPLSNLFRLRGPDADSAVARELDGLRVTLPGDRPAHYPVHVEPTFSIVGDFEITGTFELLSAEQPKDGFGCGVSLNVADSDKRNKFAKVARLMRPREGSVFMAETWRKGVPNSWRGPTVPTQTRLGQLRLVRKGNRVSHLVSDGPGKDFVAILTQDKFGPDDLTHVHFEVADGNKPGNPVDTRLIYLRILTGDKVPERAEAPAPLPPAAPHVSAAEPEDSNWLLLILAGSLAAVLVSGIWIYLRRRGAPQRALDALSFACPGCGKRLKARAALAGKRVKCPQCQALVLVPGPEIAASEPVRIVQARRSVWPAAIAFAVILVLCALVLWQSGFVGGTPETGHVHYDFRGQPRPADLQTYGDLDELFFKTEPEGLRVALPKDRTQRTPSGLEMPLSIGGDFEITATIQILSVEEPAPKTRSYGFGVLMSLNQSMRVGRLVRPNGVQVVTWDYWANVNGQRKFLSGAAPCNTETFRLRLKRQATTVSFLWAADTVGADFQQLHQCEFGDEEIRKLRIELNARRGEHGAPVDLDFRLIELRMRTAFATEPAGPWRWHWLALALGVLVAGTFLVVLLWRRSPSWPGPPASSVRSETKPKTPFPALERKHWLGLAAITGAGALVFICVWARLERDEAQIEKEKIALNALKKYGPRTELDDDGHVVLLHLGDASAGDQVMDQVVCFPRLRSLGLWHTSVTDAGIAKLVELKEVEDLNISGSRVSNQGLAILQKVTSLQRVWLRTNDRLTRSGVDSFATALPGVTVDDEALRIPDSRGAD